MLEQLLLSDYFLPSVFFIIALVYSSVGLGGGSSYTALMAIAGMNSLAIPMVSLMLNLIVTSIGSYNFIRKGHARIKVIAPFLISSIPMAYLGGTLRVSPSIFYWLLLISLIFVALRIYFWKETQLRLNLDKKGKLLLSLVAGSVLGLVSGIVGIGGGIYLVPLIIIMGIGSEKQAAACGAIFIWLNSLAGIAARFQYNRIDLTEYLPLILAVLLGGMIGSFMGSSRFSAKTMEKLLGIVIIVAIAILAEKLF